MTKIAPSAEQTPAEQDKPSLRVALIALYLYQSLGIRQISSVLRAAGHDSHLIFFKEFTMGEFREATPREEELLLATLQELKPQLIGINMTSSFVADLVYRLADKIKACLDVPIILGGAHATAMPEECLEHADYVCVGEGDEAIVDLAEALATGAPTDAIPNIWTKVNGEIRANDVRPLTNDLDRLPMVDYCVPGTYWIEADMVQLMDPAGVVPSYQTATARLTCPFKCKFCAGVYLRHVLYAGKGTVRRYRSPRAIVAEIKEACRRNPSIAFIRFWDEIFGVRAPQGWLDEFCDLYAREIGLPFEIWGHPAMVVEEQMVKLKAAGLQVVTMGVESGSEQVRKELFDRHESNARILQTAEILHRLGIEGGYDFILDLPWLTSENCRGTFELLMQLPRPNRGVMHSLSFLPRTPLAERALQEGIITPKQLALLDRPLPERFESHCWHYRLEVRNREAAVWHSLIYLASLPFTSRRLLWRLSRIRWLLRLFPRPLILGAEIARSRHETGRTRFFPALAAVYPGLAGLLARHPRLGRVANSAVRRLARAPRG